MQEKSRKKSEFVSMDKEVKSLMHGVCACRIEMKEKEVCKERLGIKVFVQDYGMIHGVGSVDRLRFMEHQGNELTSVMEFIIWKQKMLINVGKYFTLKTLKPVSFKSCK